MSVQALFYPRGVVVVGSTSEGRLGTELIRQLVAGGFQEVYAVNPRAQGLGSVPGFEAATQIGRPVDLAVIVSPPATVPAVLEDCGRAGVTAAAIVTAGFGEAGNSAGEEQVLCTAQEHGIRFVGPNCAGLVNTSHQLNPTLETRPPAGGVSLVAQSGALGGVFLAWAKQFGLGIAKFVSYGNGADLNEIDFLRYLASDPETEVVALYIESVTSGRDFMEAVRECTRSKPLVVIKGGRSRSGQRAALSHTGSMAGSDAVYDAALRQCGAIRVQSIEEMFDLCKGFLYLPPLNGRRVAIVTNSGGPGVMAADRAEEVGLEIAEPSARTRERLAEFLPSHCGFENPIDLTVEGTEAGYRETLSVLLDEYDGVLALNIAPAYLDSVPLARGICQAAELSDKAVAASFLPARIVTKAIDHLQAGGVPNFCTGERAVAALAGMARFGERRKKWRASPLLPAERGPLPGQGELLEHQAMAWLARNGVPVPDFRFATTAQATVQACRDIGYPAVVKVVSSQILHKSDCGGVRLDIRDDEAAMEAFEAVERVAGGRDFRGAIVYPMIRPVQEVLLGISRDPQFGPVVAFGLGGIYAEVWQDVSLRVAPVDREEAETMIREVKSSPLLDGARGQTPCDLDALADLLVQVSRLGFWYPEISELDLNPVLLLHDGLIVADVRVITLGRSR